MTFDPVDLVAQLQWRYATQKFDPARPIDPATWDALTRSLVLTPSSYGLQPWKFLVVDDPALRTSLRAASWNQAQITDAAKLVVFLGRTTMTDADLDRLIAAIVAARGVTAESLARLRNGMHRDLVGGPRAAGIAEWAARQVYIALGQFMLACAAVGVDACPMEGLDPAKYDLLLQLEGTGYRTLVACPAGHRAADDRYAAQAKVRFPFAEVVQTM